MRRFTVTESREVKLMAENPADAITNAAKLFSGESLEPDKDGNSRQTTLVRSTNIEASEDY